MDPSQKVRKVDYVADKDGFHPTLSDAPPEHPADSESVAKAKTRHFQLYAKIAEEHAHHPFPDRKMPYFFFRKQRISTYNTHLHFLIFLYNTVPLKAITFSQWIGALARQLPASGRCVNSRSFDL